MDFSVCWQIDIAADTPEEAARLARAHQTRAGTRATVFEVIGDDGSHWIDLTELSEKDEPMGNFAEHQTEQDAITARYEAEATEAGTRGGALSAQELATILAALRFYQQCGMGNPENRSDPIHDIATNGGTVLDLDGDEIDQLCEKLNA
ncbi:MAG: hypothetical protein GYB53_20945 [Rhodobacteraceae bacterium]|nr:hypothetical protein [Paracoccaceae bacterium]MBR9823039.1 hypothetical protein [Paracoccaceae bacterium]